jgi:ABC-2 type transport system permease protein
MTGTIFMETLRRNWRTALFWGIGMGWVGWLQIIILPDVDSLQQMAELMESLPPAMTQMFGGGDAAFMATPEGYLSLRFFSIVPLLLSFYAVTAGLNVTANEEDQGIMDMLLSLPLPRWRVVLERFLAFSLLTCGILLLSVLGLWVGTQMSTLFQVSFSTLLTATFGILPLLLAVLAFTMLVATLLRRRGQAMALAFAFVIGGYFLDTLGAAATGTILYDLRALSVFSYYDGAQAVTGAMDWNTLSLLLVVTLVFVAGGIWFFQRRDIGT